MATSSVHPIASYRDRHKLTLDAFGALVGVRKAAVCKWEGGIGPSPGKAMEIEEATSGEISKSDLRPDLWPPEVLPLHAHEPSAEAAQ